MPDERVSAMLRPGVSMPDWTEARSQNAHNVLDAMFGRLGTADRLAGLTEAEDRVWRATQEMFAFTDLVPTVQAVAEKLELAEPEVRPLLHRLRGRGLVLLDGDRVTGAYPFTLSQTLHRVRLGPRERSAMCAIDALGMGALCGTDSAIASACHGCGTAIDLRTSNAGRTLRSVEPADAVVWAGLTYRDNCAASALCQVLAFFCSATCLATWSARTGPVTEGFQLSVTEGFEVGKAIFGPVLRPAQLQTVSTITCPVCGMAKAEPMPMDACQYFYDCTGCGGILRPKAGDCCVFCSYGSAPCPPVQAQRAGGSETAACCAN